MRGARRQRRGGGRGAGRCPQIATISEQNNASMILWKNNAWRRVGKIFLMFIFKLEIKLEKLRLNIEEI